MIKCLNCQHEKFEVDGLYSKTMYDRYNRDYDYESVTLNTSYHDNLYAHICKNCGFVMLFNDIKIEK